MDVVEDAAVAPTVVEEDEKERKRRRKEEKRKAKAEAKAAASTSVEAVDVRALYSSCLFVITGYSFIESS